MLLDAGQRLQGVGLRKFRDGHGHLGIAAPGGLAINAPGELHRPHGGCVGFNGATAFSVEFGVGNRFNE